MEWTDWNAAVEKNREALKRVLVTLAGMAGPGSDRRFFLFRRKGVGSPEVARAEKGKLSPALTLPRHLHRAMLMLLRPAEAAARRLIIAAARGLVVDMPPPRTPEPASPEPLPRSLGIAVTMPPADLAHAAAAKKAAAFRADRRRTISLPLLDPLKNPFRVRDRYMPAHAVQRIMPSGDGWTYRPLPPPPSQNDPIDAARLSLRLQALAAALDDLPGQARRFARWQARNDAAIAHLLQDGGADAQDGTRHTTGTNSRRDAVSPDTAAEARPPAGPAAKTHA